MNLAKKISLLIIVVIEILLFYYGYNFDYEDSSLFSISFFSLLFCLVILFVSKLEKIVKKKIGIVWRFLMNILCISFLVLVFLFLFGFPIKMSEYRKHRILQSKEVSKTEAKIIKLDTLAGRGSSTPIAVMTYVVKKETYFFNLKNKNNQFSNNQKIELKYSLKHPDMFEILQ